MASSALLPISASSIAAFRPAAAALYLSAALKSQKQRARNGLLWSGALVGPSCAMAVTQDRVHNSASAMDGVVVTDKSDGAVDLLTEFMVKMSCEGCVKSVRNKLAPLEGVKSVDIDLANQVVRVLGSASVKDLTSAIEQTGRDARLVGQGQPEMFQISAAVAEFKGPDVTGVVRFAQVTMNLAKIEASLSGLRPGAHGWSINSYGDLTRGAASTGGIFDLQSTPDCNRNIPLGDLGILDVDSKGDTQYTGTKDGLAVSDLIGRSVVVYETEDKSQAGVVAAVIARSAGVGENYKKLCSCDGTIIWESSSNDFVKV